MNEIGQYRRVSEDSPGTTPTLVNHFNFNGMTDYGYVILLVSAAEINNIYP